MRETTLPPGVMYEFFAPFAYLPGDLELCRIRSTTHGSFDCIIQLGATTSVPATVYVADDAGEAFLASRFPECTRLRVAPDQLTIAEEDGGRTVIGRLETDLGPLRRVDLRLASNPGAKPRQVPYGGLDLPVWGSRWACWGIDLNVDAVADGTLVYADGRQRNLERAPAIVTMGSFGRLAPRAT